jgi:hypothetical protein
MTPSPLARQRCFIHDFREAAARCPVCRNAYCRECVTEHEGRVVCASCLKKMPTATAASRRRIARLAGGVLPILGLLLAWLVFYGVGRVLMLIPADVHDGTAWSSK